MLDDKQTGPKMAYTNAKLQSDPQVQVAPLTKPRRSIRAYLWIRNYKKQPLVQLYLRWFT
jgi:hypothetical protein